MNTTEAIAAVPTHYRAAAADVLGAIRAVAAGRTPSNTAAANVLLRKGYMEANPAHEPFSHDGRPAWLLTAKGQRFARSVK